MVDDTTCNECGVVIGGDVGWIMITVKNGGGYSTGFVCSTDHLVDYVATVKAMEHDESHPGWEDSQ